MTTWYRLPDVPGYYVYRQNNLRLTATNILEQGLSQEPSGGRCVLRQDALGGWSRRRRNGSQFDITSSVNMTKQERVSLSRYIDI